VVAFDYIHNNAAKEKLLLSRTFNIQGGGTGSGTEMDNMTYMVRRTVVIERSADGQVDKGVSAQASHRTVREALTSYGSCHAIKLI
jgi:hypothetical protein